MLGLVRKISEQRHRLIVDHAQPFLEDGEDVIQWVRAKSAEGKGSGFLYLTVRRCVIVWTTRTGGDNVARWEEIKAWGVRPDHPGGPLIGVEKHEGETFYAQAVAATGRMAEDARAFVRRFSELAGPPTSALEHPVHGELPHEATVEVEPQKRSLGAFTKRFVITLLGALLLTAGFVFIFLPGPAVPLILAGFAVLGSEYDWAKDMLEWSKEKFKSARSKFKSRSRSRT